MRSPLRSWCAASAGTSWAEGAARGWAERCSDGTWSGRGACAQGAQSGCGCSACNKLQLHGARQQRGAALRLQGVPLAYITTELKRRLQKLVARLATRRPSLFTVPRTQWAALLGPDEVLPLRGGFHERARPACQPAWPPLPACPPTFSACLHRAAALALPRIAAVFPRQGRP